MLLDVGFVLVGLVGLFLGGNWLVRAASRLAASLGVPPLVIGLTVVAFGTSMPELMVCLDAAVRGSSDIAIGNVVGSNIANIGLILGISGLVAAIPIHISLIKREIPVMISASLLVYVLALDGLIAAWEGALLVACLLAFTAVLIVLSRREHLRPDEERELAEEEGIVGDISRRVEGVRLLAGLVVLLVGANALVTGAVNIATGLGVSEVLIGLTLVAVGTSLPELITAVAAASQKQDEILFGNVIGSNIFNLLSILGITALVRPVAVAPELLQFDMLVMLAFALLVLPLSLNRMLVRREAVLLLSTYGLFMVVSVIA